MDNQPSNGNPTTVTFPTQHWKTGEYTGKVIMDFKFKCYYEGVPIYVNDAGYPFVRSKDLADKELANDINTKSPHGRSMDVHKISYWIETGNWSKEGVSALHHKNRNRMDARILNLELVPWDHETHNYTKDQREYRESISRRMKSQNGANVETEQITVTELTLDQYQTWKQNHTRCSLWECKVSSIGVILLADCDIPMCPNCNTVCGVGWNKVYGLFCHEPLTTGHWPDETAEVVIKGCGAFFNGYGRIVSDGQVDKLKWKYGREFADAWKLLWRNTGRNK